jgi:hypothetical protein
MILLGGAQSCLVKHDPDHNARKCDVKIRHQSHTDGHNVKYRGEKVAGQLEENVQEHAGKEG